MWLQCKSLFKTIVQFLTNESGNSMIPKYSDDILLEAEKIAQTHDVAKTYKILKRLTLADFCLLSMEVPSKYPSLKKLMPIMPLEDVQKKWVGDSGWSLLNRSCNVVRLIQLLSYKATGTGLEGKKILDYGCGWGRLLMLMNYFTQVDDIYGLDVMKSSLDECKKANILNQIALCDRQPVSLPFENIKFDLIYSFSVFSHIPDNVAQTVLAAIRKRVSKNGVLIITIRSYEFWDLRAGVWPVEMVENMRNSHDLNGYAFQTFDNGKDVNSDYGDTTMSFDYLANLCDKNGWKVSNIDRDLSEPYQIFVSLKPVNK